MMNALERRSAAWLLQVRLRSAPAALTSTRQLSKRVKYVKIDRSGLYQYPPEASERTTKPGLTPLAKELMNLIKLRGPLTIHEFMSQALNNSKYGYYQTKNAKIGTEGDFITAPEISQLFGELIGVWCVSAWHAMGKPSKVNLVELGPGKGTLMSDLLRATASFPDFQRALTINLVEMSTVLRGVQQQALQCQVNVNEEGQWHGRTPSGVPVRWHTFLREVEDAPMLLVAQEFLDAFPVHQFEYTDNGWRERLVDVDETADGPYNFRIVLSKAATPAVRALLPLTPVGKDGPKVGNAIEVNPLSLAIAEDLAIRLKRHGGAALFVDYGEDYTQPDTLRGFKQHRQVHFLEEPGQVDLTADVDFASFAHVAKTGGINVLGPVDQGAFLQVMGIGHRLEALIQKPEITDEQAQALVTDAVRLIDPKQMGTRYKVIGLTNLPEQNVPGFSMVRAPPVDM